MSRTIYWMARMDHNEAVKQQAAEKYVLGELPQTLRDEYEEHFFDCAACAVDIKAAAAFVDTSREVMRAERKKAAAPEPASSHGWFAWLRPIVAVPALATLLLVVVYQNTVTIPHAKQESARGTGEVFTSSFSLKKADTLGDEENKTADEGKILVRADESFALNFDFTPRQVFANYVGQLQDESGRAVLTVKIPGSSTNREAHLVVPSGRVHPGKYSLVFHGSAADGKTSNDEVLRLAFAIEFLQ